jgi:hypothetical protein
MQAEQAEILFRDICARLKLAPEAMRSRDKCTNMVEKRWVVAYVLHQRGAVMPDIGAMMDRRHTTIAYGIHAIEQRLRGPMASGWKRLINIAEGNNNGRGYSDDSPVDDSPILANH